MAEPGRVGRSDTRTTGQRLADRVARAVGSWRFVAVQTCVVFGWIALNAFGWMRRWDPYPFILLNLVFSVLAAYTAPIVMMSQNRQDERDRDRALADHETNIKSHAEIETIQTTLNRIEDEYLRPVASRLDALESEIRAAGATSERHG